MIVPGSLCLAHHPQHAWVPAVVENFDGKLGTVNVTYPKKETISKLKEEDIFVCDERAMDEDINDLLNLSVLHDGTLLHCLRRRYYKDIVYTNIGAIIVALNPFNFKIPWYMDEKMKDYLSEGDTIQNNLPHSWAVAHNTYYEMRADMSNQSILVSGESGAGKTEASKIVMKYLNNVSALRGAPEEKASGQLVGVKMLQSNPILEAFGNAKTVRNDNSSRFGKLMRIKFNTRGILTGADITKYLLEKSRIITAAQDERVYHSFYLLLKGCDREKYGLEPIATYKTVNTGKCTDVPGMNDGEDYQCCNEAMSICGVKDAERDSIWRVLSGILTIQSLEFQDLDGGDKCVMDSSTAQYADLFSKFLKVDLTNLTKEFLTTTLDINKTKVVKDLNRVKALDGRDSVCKAIYDNVFAWLVTTINRTIDTSDSASWVALLDIFGFEDFKVNSFEQLCINLTNETLQGHYNHYIFTRDMEECRAEGIDTTEIKFPDNKPCIDMISAKSGILSVLDEECLLGKATDLTFLDKICEKFAGEKAKMTQFFERPRLAKVPSFRIHHYAGSVTYDVENFLEKNRDTLKDAFKMLFRASADPLVATLLPEPSEGATKFTVGGFFKSQLRDLMELINSTNPHWIRCVKPHPAKKPLHFDGVTTLNQLRSSGVLGTVQIRKAGYPIRLKHADFCKRYKIVARGLDGVDFSNHPQVCTGVLKNAGFEMQKAQVGKTRVFLKSEAYQQLELLKKQKLQVFAKTAVVGALTGLARMRTACLMQVHLVRQIQALLQARESQKLFRRKDYDSRKDVIIAHVRLLLKFQKDEETKREEVAVAHTQLMIQLASAQVEALAKLEARWWAEKPQRDVKQQEDLQKEEEMQRRQMLDALSQAVRAIASEMEDDRLDSIAKQEEREEEERQTELQRIREEEERLKDEERRRLEEERIAAIVRKEEQRKLAIYLWNKKKKETSEKERLAQADAILKEKWSKETEETNRQEIALLLEEKYLQTREKAGYPPARFVSARAVDKLTRPSMPQLSATSPASPGRAKAAGAISPMVRRHIAHADDPDASPLGIGGLNPMWVNPAEEKNRLSMQRLNPDQAGSLAMVHRLRKLQTLRDATVLVTPVLRYEDLRNPMNPNSPDWNPPSSDMIVLPDGTQVNVADIEFPRDEDRHQRRRAKAGGKRMSFSATE